MTLPELTYSIHHPCQQLRLIAEDETTLDAELDDLLNALPDLEIELDRLDGVR